MTDNNRSQQRYQTPDYLILGELLRPHGVRGEMRMRILTEFPERLPELDHVFLGRDQHGTDAQPYRLSGVRFHQGYALVKFKEVPDRESAGVLRGHYVMIDIAHAVPLEEDEYYLYQLIGLTVHTSTGQAVGTVVDVLETGANDVYIVESDVHGEILIPAHDETIVEIDFEAGVITMDLPDGLLPAS